MICVFVFIVIGKSGATTEGRVRTPHGGLAHGEGQVHGCGTFGLLPRWVGLGWGLTAVPITFVFLWWLQLTDMNDLYARCWVEGMEPQESDIHWRYVGFVVVVVLVLFDSSFSSSSVLFLSINGRGMLMISA